MLCLIDGDYILYRGGFAAQRDRHTVTDADGNEVLSCTTKGELDAFFRDNERAEYNVDSNTELDTLAIAISNVKNMLEKIFKETDADEYEVYLTGKGNFREDIATILPYKGNRDPKAKPYYYDELKNYLIKKHGAVVINGMEADDALAIAQYEDYEKVKGRKNKCGTIICTVDKDLDIVPGWHCDFIKCIKYWVEPIDGLYNFYTQLLTGDSTDNIQGLEQCSESIRKKYGIRKSTGCGPKAAEKVLDGCFTEKEMHNRCFEAYREWEIEGLSLLDDEDPTKLPMHKILLVADDCAEKKLLENGRLLWMCRYEGELWCPKYG